MTSPSPENLSTPSAVERYRLTPEGEQIAKDLKEVECWFSYHVPTDRQKELLQNAHYYVMQLARFLVLNVKPSRERSIALTELRTARMLVNQSIVFDSE